MWLKVLTILNFKGDILSASKVYIPGWVIQINPCLTPDWIVHITFNLLFNQIIINILLTNG